MARKTKCAACLISDEIEKIVDGKHRLHPGDCHETYEKHKELKRQEAEWLDKVCKYIVELHELVAIPKQIVIRLQELRNGTVLQSGQKVKQYKQGVTFDLIYDSYLLATDSIKWCIKNKLNESKDVKALNYCFSIMQSKLNEAYAKKQQKIKNEEMQQKQLAQTSTEDMNYTPAITGKKKDELDISHLL